MNGVLELFKAIIQVLPMVIELVRIFKGQPKEVVAEAKKEAKKAAQQRCFLGTGVGCATDLKK